MAALPPVLPVIVQENWAQCENPNCNKWRRLPAGHPVNEDEPWYCYLNPDENKATCSASEDEYNEATTIEISNLPPPANDAEEAEHNRMIRERITANILASTSGMVLPPVAPAVSGGNKASGGKGRGKGRGRGRGRGRPPLSGRGGGGTEQDAYYLKRQRSSGGVVYREDSDDDDEGLSVSEEEPGPSAAGARSSRRQQSAYSRHFQRLLENQGSWEPAGLGQGQRQGSSAYIPPSAEAWEGLCQCAPELAEVACSAADLASSVQYFEDAPGAQQAAEAAGAVARLATMLASAAALVATEEGLTAEERQACCLDAAPAAVPPVPAAALLVPGSSGQQPAPVISGQLGAAGAPFGMPMQQQQQQQAGGQPALATFAAVPGQAVAPAGAAWQQAAQPMPAASGLAMLPQRPQQQHQQPIAANGAALPFAQQPMQPRPFGQQALPLSSSAMQRPAAPGAPIWPATSLPMGLQQQQPLGGQQYMQRPAMPLAPQQQQQQQQQGVRPQGMPPQQFPGSRPPLQFPGARPMGAQQFAGMPQPQAGMPLAAAVQAQHGIMQQQQVARPMGPGMLQQQPYGMPPGMLPQAMPAQGMRPPSPGMQPAPGMMQQAWPPMQAAPGMALPRPTTPLMPGVTPDMIQQYLRMQQQRPAMPPQQQPQPAPMPIGQQKPAAGQLAPQQQQQQQANGTR